MAGATGAGPWTCRAGIGIAVAVAFGNARIVNRIIGIVVIAVGAWLGYRGYHQADSLAGRTRTTIVDVKNSIDGKGRIAPQYEYYVVGGLLILGGAVIAMRKRTGQLPLRTPRTPG